MNYFLDHPKFIIIAVALVVIGLGKLWEAIKPKPIAPMPRQRDYEPEEIPAPDLGPAARRIVREYRRMVPPPMPDALPVQAEPEFRRQRKMLERLKANRANEAVAAVKTKAKMKPKSPALISPSKIRASLKSKRQLRHAIILKEILDPPVSLR